MNNQTLNIFDLLGNLSNLSGELTSGLVPVGEKPEISFEQVLSGMLGLETSDINIAAPKKLDPVLMPLPFAQLLETNVNPDNINVNDKKESIETLVNSIASDVKLADAKTQAVAEAPTVEIINDNENVKVNNNTVFNELNLLNNQPQRLTTILEPTQLENKTYQVIDAEIADNEVSLILKDSANPDQVIKVKLPLEMIQNGLVDKNIADNGRIDLNGYKQQPLEKLFSDLKVQQVEISNVEVADISDADADDNQIKIDFIGVKNESKVSTIIEKANLNPVKIKNIQLSQPTQVNNADQIVADEKVSGDSDDTVEQKQKVSTDTIIAKKASGTVINDQPKEVVNLSPRQNNIGKAAVLDESGNFSKNEKFDLLGISDTTNRANVKITDDNGLVQNQNKPFDFTGLTTNEKATTHTIDESATLFSTDKFDFKVSHNNNSTSVQPVRINLPETLTTAQKTGHQSIQLDIHPDDLGPAKLHLSLTHDDKLRARVMVHSPEAKAVLEQSVDRLVDQLNKINIKVDLINVHVAGDGKGNQMFSGQSQWQRRMTKNNFGSNENLDSQDSIPPQAFGSIGVVHAAGVNVLA